MNATLWLEGIFIALRDLRAHPLRTFLTILGFTIALAALLAMVGVGEGTRRKVIRDIEILGGARIVSVQVGGQFLNNPAYRYDTTRKLALEDVEAIRRSSAHISQVVPTIFRPYSFTYKKNRFVGSFLGTTPDYAEIRNWKVQQGRFFTDIDLEKRTNVCVIGAEVREQLFGREDPVGSKIFISGRDFTVIGTMVKWNLESSRMLNSFVLLPLTSSGEQIDGKPYFDEIFTKIDDIQHVPIVQRQILRSLSARHQDMDVFKVYSQSEVIENLLQSSSLMSFTFGIISLIILFVGGIGIMNLMLVSVTERTREIGIYKAVGATDSTVFSLFLAEAVIMSCLGGGLGTLLGVNGSRFIVRISELILHNRIESIIPLHIVFLAFGVSALLGVFFGIYPALNAARVDPGRALRYE